MIRSGGVAALAVAIVLSVMTDRPRAAGLSGIDRLSTAYDDILDAHFTRAEQALASACGPGAGQAPPEACQVLGATATWWRILLNPNDTSLDVTFEKQADAAVDACERWTTREPSRAESWFYLGAAYGIRVSWKVQRGERLSAARDGKHIKESLERALQLDPGLDDARFGIGLYKYYADIAPTFAKVLRFFLMLPGGDRVAGLHDMEAVHRKGKLLKGEADYQLHWIYLWYEKDPARARELLASLRTRYPDNPHFSERMAVVERDYFHDAAASLAVWQSVIDGAARMSDPALAETEGRLGASVDLDSLDETDRALDDVRKVLAAHPTRPYGAAARARLLEGRWLARLGRRDEARVAFKAALAALPDRDPDGIADQVHAATQAMPDQAGADAYRTSLLGWRAYERGALDQAWDLLSRARRAAPEDAVIAVRTARVAAARHDDGALAAYDAVIARRATAAPIAVSAAYEWSAELLESRGDLDGARARYRAATGVFAGDSRRAHDATRALARLGGR